MRLIYKPDNENFIWSTEILNEDEELPEGFTVIPPPKLNWRPIFDWETNEWVETATPDEIIAMEYGVEDISEAIKLVKESKINDLKSECNQRIIDGFTLDNEHYSYSQEKQINFQDTYQLFLNNMITEISWNAYIDGEKTRVLLDKDKFQRVYLAGVKHKVDAMSRLNDVLIPMVNSADSKEVVARIYWDEGLESDSLKLNTGSTISKNIEKVEKTTKEVQDSSFTTMMALMQISSLIK